MKMNSRQKENVFVTRDMRKMVVTVNRVSRLSKIRRLVYFLIFCIIVFIPVQYQFQYKFGYSEIHSSTSESKQRAAPYTKYTDQDGEWLPFHQYRILQHVVNPLAQTFQDFYAFFDSNDEWKLYFKYLPIDSYHVTLAELKNASEIDEEDLKLLRNEQDYLDSTRVDISVKGVRLVFLDQLEIRVEVEFPNDHFEQRLKPLQNRWKEKFPSLMVEVNEKFFVTLAVQYRDLPSDEMKQKIREALKQWEQWTLAIELDPIEICHHSTFADYFPVVF